MLSQFSIKIFGVHFGNSVLDNSNWDKISHSLTKRITHMWGRWGTRQNFLLAFINEFWKTRKIRLLKKWKNLLEISPFYTCVPKTTIIWGTVPEIQSETNLFCHFGQFFALPPSPLPPHFIVTTQKTKILKKWKKHLEMSSF